VDAQSFCFVEVLVSEGKEKASKKDSSAKETSSWWSMFSVETLKKAKRTKNAP